MGDEVLFVRSKKSKDDENSSQDESGAWDDTVLIEAYDNAVSLAKEEVKRRMGISEMDVSPNSSDIISANPSKQRKTGGKTGHSSKKGKWVVGDACRCVYTEDGISYEACIIQLDPSNGSCVVKYVGYDNEEMVDIKSLQYSHGHTARLRQAEEAAEVKSRAEAETQKKQTKEETIPKRSFKRECKSPQHNMDWNCQGHSNKYPRPGVRHETSSPHSFQRHPMGLPPMMFPPPPPIHLMPPSRMNNEGDETEALSCMLMSWYMSGFHTGYYQGVKHNTQSPSAGCSKCTCKNKH